jgi:hypothetical protein
LSSVASKYQSTSLQSLWVLRKILYNLGVKSVDEFNTTLGDDIDYIKRIKGYPLGEISDSCI